MPQVGKDKTTLELQKQRKLEEIQNKAKNRELYKKSKESLKDTGSSLFQGKPKKSTLESLLDKTKLDENLKNLLTKELNVPVGQSNTFIQSLQTQAKSFLLDRFSAFAKIFKDNFTVPTSNNLKASFEIFNRDQLNKIQDISIPTPQRIREYLTSLNPETLRRAGIQIVSNIDPLTRDRDIRDLNTYFDSPGRSPQAKVEYVMQAIRRHNTKFRNEMEGYSALIVLMRNIGLNDFPAPQIVQNRGMPAPFINPPISTIQAPGTGGDPGDDPSDITLGTLDTASTIPSQATLGTTDTSRFDETIGSFTVPPPRRGSDTSSSFEPMSDISQASSLSSSREIPPPPGIAPRPQAPRFMEDDPEDMKGEEEFIQELQDIPPPPSQIQARFGVSSTQAQDAMRAQDPFERFGVSSTSDSPFITQTLGGQRIKAPKPSTTTATEGTTEIPRQTRQQQLTDTERFGVNPVQRIRAQDIPRQRISEEKGRETSEEESSTTTSSSQLSDPQFEEVFSNNIRGVGRYKMLHRMPKAELLNISDLYNDLEDQLNSRGETLGLPKMPDREVLRLRSKDNIIMMLLERDYEPAQQLFRESRLQALSRGERERLDAHLRKNYDYTETSLNLKPTVNPTIRNIEGYGMKIYKLGK
jgi:hypothetical protein